MKNKPQTKRADDKSDYKKELDELGTSSKFDKSDTDLLKQMYVGAKNKPQTKKTAGTLELPLLGEVDNPPQFAVNFDYPDEKTVGFEDDEQFGVKESEMETDGLELSKDLYKTHTNPAGKKDTAERATETPFEVSAEKEKKNVKQAAREAQAKIANAKNLAELMVRKSLISREALPNVAKQIVQLDNKSFGLVKSIVEQFSTTTKRSAKASVEEGLKTPIHVARPNVKGSRYLDQFDDAPWSDSPPKGYDHKKYSNGY